MGVHLKLLDPKRQENVAELRYLLEVYDDLKYVDIRWLSNSQKTRAEWERDRVTIEKKIIKLKRELGNLSS